jgi:hypothetical protein
MIPCKNNGSCVNSNGSYECNCTEFWEGIDCSLDIDECLSNPCKSDFKCMNIDNGYDCLNCSSITCQNGGNCADSSSGPTCTCKSGWTGEYCKQQDFCNNRPCKALENCTNEADGYTCHFHPCNSSPCINKGPCIEHDLGYYCKCSVGWIGEYCQYEDFCLSSPCSNNGTCQLQFKQSYPLSIFIHLKSDLQGLLKHSSISREQSMPSQNSVQLHLYDPFEFTQLPLFLHGIIKHSSMSSSHCNPVQPGLHLQM